MNLDLKYRIRALLLNFPNQNSFMQNKYALCIALDISERTLDNWIKTPSAARFSIPSDHLFKIANFFQCTIDALLTKPTTATING